MMFAHAEFEREVRSLVDATNPKEPGFGERHDNQWTASESGTAKIIVLIMRHCGSGRPQIDQIRNLLDDAVDLCGGSAISLLTARGGASTAGP